MCISCDDAFLSIQMFYFVILIVTFDIHIWKFNICHDNWTVRDRTSIFHMYIYVVRPFPSYSFILFFLPCGLDRDLWLTYIKTLSCQIFDLVTLIETLNQHIWKVKHLPEIFTIRSWFFKFYMYFYCDQTLPSVQMFWPCNFDRDLWPTYLKI